jgi:hypothetical protein
MEIDQSYFAPFAVGIRPSVSWLDQTRSEVDRVFCRQSLKQSVFFHNTLKPRSLRDLVTSHDWPIL